MRKIGVASASRDGGSISALFSASLRATDLSKAALVEANLGKAFLLGAKLSEAYLIGANLSGADLRRVINLAAPLDQAHG